MRATVASIVRTLSHDIGRRKESATFGLISAVVAMAIFSSTALAGMTHKYLYSFPTSTGQFPTYTTQVGGVDPQGNVYVFSTVGYGPEEGRATISRYDGATGAPVPFSALGTNVIDGEGGSSCPTVPTDCDRLPGGQFFSQGYVDIGGNAMAIDQSNGPASGYIYVLSNQPRPNPEVESLADYARVDAFDPTGKYVGRVSLEEAYPEAGPGNHVNAVSVDSRGQIYVSYCCYTNIDRFAVVSTHPWNTEFIGQIRSSLGWGTATGGRNYTYGNDGDPGGYTGTAYFNRWTNSEAYFLPSGTALPTLPVPFGDGNGNDAGAYSVAVDPENEHVYLAYGEIEEWDEGGFNQIGPAFGAPYTSLGGGGIGSTTTVRIDRSGGPTDGYLYAMGSANNGSSVAVFSDHIPLPNVTYNVEVAGHTQVQLSADVGLAGGPPVTFCQFEFAGGIAPCNPGPPYAADGTVTGTLTGLPVGASRPYRLVIKTENGTTFGDYRTAQTVAVLDVRTDPADSIEPNSAILHGALNADNLPTEYHFEFGITSDYDQTTPVHDAQGSSQSSIPGAVLTGLQKGRTYHYAVVATNTLGMTVGADRTFTTTRSPTINGIRADNVTETSADIHARVDPFGYETTYSFEYGKTPSYGSEVPIGGESIGSSETPQPVEAHLNDLDPGITYHYRVVAKNKWGTTVGDDATFSFDPPSCPNAHVRQQSDASYLPDCRAYELVTPSQQGSIQLLPGDILVDYASFFAGEHDDPRNAFFPANTGLASSPPRFAFYGAAGVIPGTNPPNSLLDMYITSRTQSGWETTYAGLDGDETFKHGRMQCSVTLDTCLDHKNNMSTEEFEPRYENAPYVFGVDGTSRGHWPTNVAAVPDGKYYVGANRPSGDFNHYAFSSRDQAFALGGVTSAPGSAYDNVIGERTVSIISKTPSGADIPSDIGNAEEFIRFPAVSTDGSHVLMSTLSDEGPVNLYMRVNGMVTYEVARGVRFVGMTPDGGTVLFTTHAQVADDDIDRGTDLYMWQEAANAVTLLSVGGGEGNSDSCSAVWAALCGVQAVTPERPELDDEMANENGAAYFYSPELLDPNEPGVPNQRNLYVANHGEVRLVTTFDPGTQANRMQISPGGQYAAFLTRARLTGYDNAGYREMYAYDASKGAVQCVSCNPSGDPPTADVAASQSGRFMSDDGRTFFATSDALVSQDTDGIIDVYEFVGGRPQLISAGTGEQDRFPGDFGKGILYPGHDLGLEAVSADGVDVYFSTYDSLVPQDQNGNFIKFYDARTGGGFLAESRALPCTAADECHGVGSAPQGDLRNGTGATLGASGNIQPGAERKATKRQQKRRRARHSRKRRRAHQSRNDSVKGSHG